MILCAITPEFHGESYFRKVEKALSGGVDILQYRDKLSQNTQAETVARKLQSICNEHGTMLYVDDRVKLASDIGAYGVHVGKDDMRVKEIRENFPGLHIGGSAYCNPQLALELQKEGCDYVAFGSMFHTETKKDYEKCYPEILNLCRKQLSIPVLAIGGISRLNASIFRDLGYSGIAVSSSIFHSEDPEEEVRKIREQIS
jgi:thiamine-phosphate pyrophosphorylase